MEFRSLSGSHCEWFTAHTQRTSRPELLPCSSSCSAHGNAWIKSSHLGLGEEELGGMGCPAAPGVGVTKSVRGEDGGTEVERKEKAVHGGGGWGAQGSREGALSLRAGRKRVLMAHLCTVKNHTPRPEGSVHYRVYVE